MIALADPNPRVPWTSVAELAAVWLAGGLALLPLVAFVVRTLVPERRVVFVRWGFSHVALVVLAILAAQIVFRLVGPSGDDSTAYLLLASGVSLAVGGALVASFAIKLDPAGLACLGFWRGGHLRAIAAGLFTYVATLPALVGFTVLWFALLAANGVPLETQEIARRFAELPAGERLVPLVAGIVVQPFLEELLFRGFLQPLLVQNFREKAGIALTSILFGVLHGGAAIVPIFALSLVLGAIKLRTQRLTASWAVHALHNGIMFALMFHLPEVARS